jgi:hypothetical protein
MYVKNKPKALLRRILKCTGSLKKIETVLHIDFKNIRGMTQEDFKNVQVRGKERKQIDTCMLKISQRHCSGGF